MLVITRRREEAIIIGDGIEVRVLRVGKDAAATRHAAPPGVPSSARSLR
jgi:sRNA-binding carbon storage regulator CsrA